jgi:homoserine kinase
VLLDKKLPDEAEAEELLQMAGTLEGHVDNVAPCIYGGMRVSLDACHVDGGLKSPLTQWDE